MKREQFEEILKADGDIKSADIPVSKIYDGSFAARAKNWSAATAPRPTPASTGEIL